MSDVAAPAQSALLATHPLTDESHMTAEVQKHATLYVGVATAAALERARVFGADVGLERVSVKVDVLALRAAADHLERRLEREKRAP